MQHMKKRIEGSLRTGKYVLSCKSPSVDNESFA